MNKAELVKQIATTTGLSQAQASQCLAAFIESISQALAKGERLTLPGFGTFETRQRSERIGRNPQTGAELKVPASTTPAFKAGQGLKDAVRAD